MELQIENQTDTVGPREMDGVKVFHFGGGVIASLPFDKLFGAMVKAHGQISPAPRSEAGQEGNRNYKYADLAAIHEATHKALSDNGLGVSQHPSQTHGNSVTVTTIVMHGDSGQWLISPFTIISEKGGPKALGSAITYARRYGKLAIFDIVTEDDDADAASRGPNDPDNRQRNQQQGNNQQAGQQQQQQRPPQQGQGQGQKQITPPPPKNDGGGPPPTQQGQAQSPGAGHLDPEHVKQTKEAEKREYERMIPLRALKTVIFQTYSCQNAADADLLIAYATGDREKTIAWLNNNPDKAPEVAEQLSKWATENEVKPAEALGIIRNMESAKEAFPQ